MNGYIPPIPAAKNNTFMTIMHSLLISIMSIFMLGSCVISSNPLNFGFRCGRPEPFPATWILIGAFTLAITSISFGFLATLRRDASIRVSPLLISGISLGSGLLLIGLLAVCFIFLGGYTLVMPLFTLIFLAALVALALAIAKKAGLAIPTIVLGMLILPFLMLDALVLAFVCG